MIRTTIKRMRLVIPAMLLCMFMPEAVPFFLLFTVFDVLTSAAWIALILLCVLPVSKWWLLAAPLVTVAIGTVPELLPLPLSGINSGFESLGWMLMFVCGIRYIRREHESTVNKSEKPGFDQGI